MNRVPFKDNFEWFTTIIDSCGYDFNEEVNIVYLSEEAYSFLDTVMRSEDDKHGVLAKVVPKPPLPQRTPATVVLIDDDGEASNVKSNNKKKKASEQAKPTQEKRSRVDEGSGKVATKRGKRTSTPPLRTMKPKTIPNDVPVLSYHSPLKIPVTHLL